MKNICTIFAVLLAIGDLSMPQQESREARKMYKQFRDYAFDRFMKTSKVQGLKRAAELDKLQVHLDNNVPFPCDVKNGRSPTPPKTVHQLRPGDFDITCAIGDSLTAGNGIASSQIFHVLIENRGLSASGGGQGTWRQFLTLPNILKEYNPKIFGYATGDALGHHKTSQFNVAEPGAMSRDMPFMAKELVRRLKGDKRVDIKNHWKLINILVGANDFCLDFCYMKRRDFRNSSEIHRNDLIRTLDILRDNLPRTFINLIVAPSIDGLNDIRMPSLCKDFHIVTCPCLFGLSRKSTYATYSAMQVKWQKVQKEVAADKRYQTKSDFAVVAQPFASHLTLPDKKAKNGGTDVSMLAADCFHFSQKANAVAANALWNNMLEPLGNKTETWYETFERFLCPTEEHPYFYTFGN